MGEKYDIHIIKRDGLGQTRDDYHATVTRSSDGAQTIVISDYLWLLKRRVRRKALDRLYKSIDKREKKFADSEQRFTV